MAKDTLTPKEVAALRHVLKHHEKQQWLKEQRRLQRAIWARWATGTFMATSAIIEVANFVLRLMVSTGGGGSP